MSENRIHLLNPGLIISMLILLGAVVFFSRFMLVRVEEDSMDPTLTDGQWALVLRGAGKVHPGDIAVFASPLDNRLVVKRYIFGSDARPVIDHGWLITPWGRWFLTGPQWKKLEGEKNLPDGLFFMVGDNQFQSLDSRSYGYVRQENLVGRVLTWRKNG